MKIQNISIEKSALEAGVYRLAIQVNDCEFQGYFGDFGGFISAVTEATKFFAVRAGLLRVRDAGFTRDVMPGRMGDEMLLPGERKH